MQITIKTNDGVIIVGDFENPSGASHAVILLHMMPANRHSFKEFCGSLNKIGIATVAIDLRGHGQSINAIHDTNKNITLDYKKFSDKEHQASRLDVDGVMNFLKGKGFEEKSISFVGASIGANLSLDALIRYKDTQRALLLSPGLDYRGIKTLGLINQLSEQQKAWLISGEQDTYSMESVHTLHQKNPTQTKLSTFPTDAHGTNLFALYPNLIAECTGYFRG